MRRLSFEQRVRVERLRLKRLRKGQRRRIRLLKARRRRKVSGYGGRSYAVLRAPAVFFLSERKTHDELLEFLNKLRDFVATEYIPVKIDFSRTERMIAGGTLLFYAELDRLHRAYPHKFPLACIPPLDDTVGQVLTHLGFFNSIHCSKTFTPKRDDVVQWRSATGLTVDAAAEAGPMLDETQAITAEILPRIFRGVSEAMTNVVHHAYYRAREDGLPIPSERRWWMFCREEKGRVSVGFCDLGLGIPVTLRERGDQNLLGAILSSINAIVREGLAKDCDMIKAAILLRKTRTQLQHQGKGLTDILNVIEGPQSGYIAIYSNKGCYSKHFDGTPVEYLRMYRRSIFGTLIFWSLPISK